MRLFILAACLLFGAARGAHLPVVDDDATGSRYQSEWWRLSAVLADPDGRLWGLEWALYRQHSSLPGARGAPSTGSMSLAYVAITDPDGGYFEQRFEDGEMLRADDDPAREIVIAEQPAGWQWVSPGAALLPARLSFGVGDQRLNLLLDSVGGATGSSEQPAATALDHAVSDSPIRVRGFLERGAGKTYLRGHGRLEREWQTPLPSGGD